jgi:hypothetical protein
MGTLQCNSSSFCGRVRFMCRSCLFYSFVVVLASYFATPVTAVAENRLSGFVFASDTCQLRPPAKSEACLAALIPVTGTLALRKRGGGGGQRQLIELSKTGTFTKRVGPGRYNVRLVKGRSGNVSLNKDDFRLYPPVVSVGKAGIASHNSVYLMVSHRSRPPAPFAGVSDGCEGR